MKVDVDGNVSVAQQGFYGTWLWQISASNAYHVKNNNLGNVGICSSTSLITSKFQFGGSVTKVCIGDASNTAPWFSGYIGFSVGKPATETWIIESNGTSIGSTNAASAIISDLGGNLRFVTLPITDVNANGPILYAPDDQYMLNATKKIIKSDGKIRIGIIDGSNWDGHTCL